MPVENFDLPEEDFAVFLRTCGGLVWKNCCDNLGEAKRRAEEITTTEGVESFVLDLRSCCKVATFLPERIKLATFS